MSASMTDRDIFLLSNGQQLVMLLKAPGSPDTDSLQPDYRSGSPALGLLDVAEMTLGIRPLSIVTAVASAARPGLRPICSGAQQ